MSNRPPAADLVSSFARNRPSLSTLKLAPLDSPWSAGVPNVGPTAFARGEPRRKRPPRWAAPTPKPQNPKSDIYIFLLINRILIFINLLNMSFLFFPKVLCICKKVYYADLKMLRSSWVQLELLGRPIIDPPCPPLKNYHHTFWRQGNAPWPKIEWWEKVTCHQVQHA